MRVYHPSFGHEINVDVGELSEDPDTQVAQVIDMMLDYSDADSKDAGVYNDALRGCALGGGDCLSGNFQDVKNSIQFVQDEDTAEPFTAWLNGPIPEVLVRPVDMRRMAYPQGDCDCFATTLRARLKALGIPAGFVTVAVDPEDPTRFSHVYNVADCSHGKCGPMWSGRVPLDSSHGDYPGWECPNPFGKRQEWNSMSPGFKIGCAVLLLAAVGAAAWWVWR